ncbi:hypothetical protein Tco_0626830 [Tanacetum coccineum]|uniref:Uncharacterized protein n=1 Tax=Tanacetum coccineum TaxID=301880 RepID=A0ABQ4WKZ3_9ASTR
MAEIMDGSYRDNAYLPDREGLRGEGGLRVEGGLHREGGHRGEGRRSRLHPLGYFSEGRTPKDVGLRVADSHIGNHRKDDFTPLETFRGFPSAFGVTVKAITGHTGSCESCHTAKKVEMELAGSYGGWHISCCCEGYNEAYWLLRRMPYKQQAATKAAIKVEGFYEGCHKGSNRASWLLQRLLQRVQTAVKAAI